MLRDYAEKYIQENFVENDLIVDAPQAFLITQFYKYVKLKEKERRAAQLNQFVQDPAPMIGLNPFKKDVSVSPEPDQHLFVPVTKKADADFNRLLNYRIEEQE